MEDPTEWDDQQTTLVVVGSARRTPKGRTWNGDMEEGADPPGRPGREDDPAHPGKPGTLANRPTNDLPRREERAIALATHGRSALDVERTARTRRQGLR